MPYVKQEYREELDEYIYELGEAIDSLHKYAHQHRDGLLNYTITRLIKDLYPNATYHDYNEIIGMLECCKLEVYRKMVAPYEDVKELENGSV